MVNVYIYIYIYIYMCVCVCVCVCLYINFFENRDLYETMWRKCCRGTQTTNGDIIWRMSIECWIPKATNTHSEYAILTAFPLQQLLHQNASMLHYAYIA